MSETASPSSTGSARPPDSGPPADSRASAPLPAVRTVDLSAVPAAAVAPAAVGTLDPAHPLAQVAQWLEAAVQAGELDPTAMALATISPAGDPEVRTVLLKGCDARGLVFYTNLGSPKAAALAAHPRAAVNFWWPKSRRQLRASGPIERVTAAEADAYFASRPRLSQLGAWASVQSQPLGTPVDLETRVAAFGVRYALGSVPRPAFWSGFRLRPTMLEFWEERAFRLHVRRQWTHDDATGTWHDQRLFP